MKYARIENNKVQEIIDFNPQGRFTQELVDQFVECADDVKEGYNFIDNVFTPYIKPPISNAEHNTKIIQEVQTTDSQLTRHIEDITEFLITLGYEPIQEILDLIQLRKNKRKELK